MVSRRKRILYLFPDPCPARGERRERERELKEACLFFLPKRKGEIKAVLDRQLSPDRHELKRNSNIDSSEKT